MTRILLILVVIFLAHAWINRGNNKTPTAIVTNEWTFVKDHSIQLVDTVKQRIGVTPSPRPLSSGLGDTLVVEAHTNAARLSGVTSVIKKITQPALNAEKKRVDDLNKQINQSNP